MEEFAITHGDDAPSGENLEYDPVFTDMLRIAQPGEERQVGDEIVPGTPSDPAQVSQAAAEVLARSHDLRAAVVMAEARTRADGLPAFADMARYIAFCLRDHWATCHPQLDADDDDDPTMRVNAVSELAAPSGMVRTLRLAPLTQSATFGRISLRDIEVVEGTVAPPQDGSSVPDSGAVGAAFKDTEDGILAERLVAAQTALTALTEVDAVFDERLPGRGPDLTAPQNVLRRMITRLSAEVGVPVDAGADDAPGGAAPAASATVPGAIGGTDDVRRMLDQIMDYYERHEPSSPVPVLLRRAHRLVGADFLTIVRDMAPSGMKNVANVGGIADAEDDD